MELDYFEIRGFRVKGLMRMEQLDLDLVAVISIILLLYSAVTQHLLIMVLSMDGVIVLICCLFGCLESFLTPLAVSSHIWLPLHRPLLIFDFPIPHPHLYQWRLTILLHCQASATL